MHAYGNDPLIAGFSETFHSETKNRHSLIRRTFQMPVRIFVHLSFASDRRRYTHIP